ncbi:unnamed protein product [Ectocarpus fasciculatus]
MAAATPDVYFKITIGGRDAGTLVFRLFYETTPRTAQNFKALCTGECGIGKTTGKPLHYRGIPFHRIIKGFMCQGGDFSNKNGTGGESIFGGKFRDENFTKRHTKAGLLSMANAGPNTQGSQFFITLKATPHLDGKHCVFGELVQGADILNRMANVTVGPSDKPVFGEDVVIADCGIVPARGLSEGAREKSNKKESKKKDKKSKKEKKEKKRKHDKDHDDRRPSHHKRSRSRERSPEDGDHSKRRRSGDRELA